MYYREHKEKLVQVINEQLGITATFAEVTLNALVEELEKYRINKITSLQPLKPQAVQLDEKEAAFTIAYGKAGDLMQTIRKYAPQVKSVKQLRASVITHWLGKNNMREVQYMAGHKYVSSTELYQQTKLEDLQKDVNSFHPLK